MPQPRFRQVASDSVRCGDQYYFRVFMQPECPQRGHNPKNLFEHIESASPRMSGHLADMPGPELRARSCRQPRACLPPKSIVVLLANNRRGTTTSLGVKASGKAVGRRTSAKVKYPVQSVQLWRGMMCFRGASIAVTISAAIATLTAPPTHADSRKLTICEGISAEQASRLNMDYHGQGSLRPSAGQVKIETPCGPVVCAGGRGYARPSNPMLDGKIKGPSSRRMCSWLPAEA